MEHRKRGFTIVELLIVIVVIGILAAITIVSFNGVTKRAVTATLNSDLSNSIQTIALYQAENGDSYPTSLSSLNSGAGLKSSSGNVYGYAYDNTTSPKTFCLTALNGTNTPRSVTQDGTYSDGACAFAVGGLGYCPESSYIALNGYYCDGTVGSTASQNSPVVKQLATASGVPSGAPSYYVGVQTSRDNLIGPTMTVAAGDSYCFSGYAATASSAVVHTIGLQMTGPSVSTIWYGVNNLSPSSAWQKLSGCITVPSGYNSARFWTQNNGDATTAAVAWYQTALMIVKQ